MDLEHSLDLEHYVPATKFGFMLQIYLDLVHSLDLETSTTDTKTGFLDQVPLYLHTISSYVFVQANAIKNDI